MIEAYGELVRRYHHTLDLVSDRALRNWPELTGVAQVYGSLLAEMAPEAQTVLDIGSGAGLPAVPLAIARPDLRFHLVERRRRRAAFLRLVAGELGLVNVQVHSSDVRDVTGFSADVVTAQAVGSFGDLYCLSSHLQAPEVLLLSRKGSDWPEEMAGLSASTGLEALSSQSAAAGEYSQVVGIRLAGGAECR